MATIHPLLPFSYYGFTVASMWIIYLFETYLDYRQYCRMHQKERPKAIEAFVDEKKFTLSQSYNRDKSRFNFVSGLYSHLESYFILCFYAMPWLWNRSGDIIAMWGFGPEYEVTQSVVFAGLGTLFSTATSLPFDLYRTFVIEERHGFNKQTGWVYFTDQVKSLLLTFVIGGPLIALFLHIIKWGGEWFYIYVFVFLFAVQMLALTIYPVLIQPCFNKVTPLPDGELRTAIEELAAKISFPLKKLYEIDGSRRSSHSNAYFYGFCSNKRIVLFDTLIKQSTKDEVVAVLGHELGHWKLNHTIKGLIIAEVHMFSLFWVFSKVISNPALYADFGFGGSMPTLVGFMLFGHVLSPLEHLLAFLKILLSRLHEFQADRFAVDLGYGPELRSGLIKLQLENLGNMNPDWAYSTYKYSHPPLVERLAAIDAAVDTSKKTQ